jgi:hypothetical protein
MKGIDTRAVVTVGDGRGFVVFMPNPSGLHPRRVIVTAAHCLPGLPPAHSAAHTWERTWKLLAPLGAKPAVLAECLFVDPIGDVAVLGTPDTEQLPDEAEAYDALVDSVRPFKIGKALPPKYERGMLSPIGGKQLRSRPFWTWEPSRADVRVLTLNGRWIEVPILCTPYWLSATDLKGGVSTKHVEGGMSGSPIVALDGRAIGVISTGADNPILTEALPARFLPRGRPKSR